MFVNSSSLILRTQMCECHSTKYIEQNTIVERGQRCNVSLDLATYPSESDHS